jgi:GTP cyclohydrolase I
MSTILYGDEFGEGDIHGEDVAVAEARIDELAAHRRRSVIDLPAAEQAVRDLLEALGRDPESPHLEETPRRVAHAFAEQLTTEPFAPTTFPNDAGYDDLVLVRDIPFHSLCEHHLLPFTGIAHVGYLPGERIVGLSKLARAVDYFSRDLQVQERLTVQLRDWLDDELAPRGAGVVVKATHSCMELRGIRSHGTSTVTSAFSGMLEMPQLQQRFWSEHA